MKGEGVSIFPGDLSFANSTPLLTITQISVKQKMGKEGNVSLSRGDQPRSGRGGDENLIAVTLSCPLNNRRDQTMPSPHGRSGGLPL